VSSGAFRPGIALGSYPERDEPRASWFDRIALRWSGGRPQHALGALTREAERIEQRRAQLAQLGADAFAEAVRDVRRRLRSEGVDGAAAGEAFALVCETARRTLGTSPYGVQIIGGTAILRGMLAEMQTGEGKTLTASLPAATAALAGIPTHVVTVNDYLVARDADWMRPIYAALGLTVGVVLDADPDPARRRAAYRCDVTYATNKQIAFDYLRDRLIRRDRRARLRNELRDALGGEYAAPLLRGLCFAIVDEADSVLIDEARTPLILSRSRDLGEASALATQALGVARALTAGRDYSVNRRERRVALSGEGAARVAQLSAGFGGGWANRQRRDELAVLGVSALCLYARDEEYVVRNEQIQIVDPNTGRAMPDRSWESGLHQMIEAKEGCPVTAPRETIARISYQQFYRRYLRLGGMTGTAREVAAELLRVYRLPALRIPTRLPCARRRSGERVLATAQEKWAAVVARAAELATIGRPTLIGTGSVAASEELSRRLRERNLAHRVLNARQDGEEAQVVAQAGQRGCITVATAMAGRGTDIHLGEGVRELGGLHVIATARAEARRIDRQLIGRCARQGDPGSYELITSLDDELVASGCPAWLRQCARWLLAGSPALGEPLAMLCGAVAQRVAERRHARIRRALVDHEERLEALLALSGPSE
jgi:preprotein translocase subunit SecA